MAQSRLYTKWDDKELKVLESLSGLYTCKIIGEKLNRSEYSVRRKLRDMGLSQTQLKSSRGIPPAQFSEMTGIHITTIHHLIRAKKLPVIEKKKETKFDKLHKMHILIDDSKLKDWMMQGYVYHRDMNPKDSYIKRMVLDVRRELDILWISKKDVVECLRRPVRTIENWQSRNGFPKLCCRLHQMSITMFLREEVIQWCLANPHVASDFRIRSLRYTGIGKGLEL